MLEATEVLEPVAAVDETTLPVTTPEATDPTSPPGAAGEEPAPTGTEPPGSDRARDANGRFVKQDAGPPDAAKVAETTALAAPPPVAVAAPPAPAAGEPFVFRAEGQRIPVQGATLSADGQLTIPADQVPAIRQLLSEGVIYRSSYRKERDGLQEQIKTANAASDAKAAKYNKASVILWDRVASLLQENPHELELLRRELDLELRSADLNIPKAAPEPAAPDPKQLESAARSVLEEELESLLDGPQAKALYTPDERKALTARYQRRLQAYFVEHEGSVALDREILKADFDDEVKDRQAARKLAEDARKAAEFNAKRNQPAVNAPPVVQTKAPPVVASDAKKPSTRDEWRQRQGMT